MAGCDRRMMACGVKTRAAHPAAANVVRGAWFWSVMPIGSNQDRGESPSGAALVFAGEQVFPRPVAAGRHTLGFTLGGAGVGQRGAAGQVDDRLIRPRP